MALGWQWFALPSPRSGAFFVVGWLAGWLLLWRPRHLPAPISPGGRPAIAVIVPARDEAAVIGPLVTSVRAGLRAGDEFVVVDDRSGDGTGARAAAAGARVVEGTGPPPGWLGKPAACWAGAAATTAPVLIFLDADVAPGPALFDRLARAHLDRPDALVSVQPWHRTGRIVERAALLFNVVALMGSRGFTVAGRAGHGGRPLAFGPVLACSRARYLEVGGHAAPTVRRAVAEDLALGEAFGEVEVFMGADAVSLRMYPNGLRSLVEGFTKNLATGAAHVRWWVGVLSAAWLWSLAGGVVASFWCYLLSTGQLAVQARRTGRFGVVTAAVHPILVVLFVAVFVRSAALTVRRRPVRWKGREVPSRPD